jgi:hypothetical protein
MGEEGGIAKHGRGGRDSKTRKMRDGEQIMGEGGGISKHRR